VDRKYIFNWLATGAAATVVLAVRVNAEFDVSVAVTLCEPVASNVTWNEARPSLKVTLVGENTAVVSVVLDNVTVSVKLDTGWLLAVNATNSTVSGEPAVAPGEKLIFNCVATGGATTFVLAVTVSDEFVVSVAVTLCEPMASNVTWNEA
jgi:hypothetical protein